MLPHLGRIWVRFLGNFPDISFGIQLDMYGFMTFNLLTLFILTMSVNGCVSVNLGKDKIKRSQGVSYLAPKPPFVEFKANHVDMAWKNVRNGNSISYLTECDSSTDPSLNHITQSILNSFEKPKLMSRNRVRYNGRSALRTKVVGEVDGVPSMFDVVVLKKNNCIYIFTYVALTETFNGDIESFNSFLNGFSAP